MVKKYCIMSSKREIRLQPIACKDCGRRPSVKLERGEGYGTKCNDCKEGNKQRVARHREAYAEPTDGLELGDLHITPQLNRYRRLTRSFSLRDGVQVWK